MIKIEVTDLEKFKTIFEDYLNFFIKTKENDIIIYTLPCDNSDKYDMLKEYEFCKISWNSDIKLENLLVKDIYKNYNYTKLFDKDRLFYKALNELPLILIKSDSFKINQCLIDIIFNSLNSPENISQFLELACEGIYKLPFSIIIDIKDITINAINDIISDYSNKINEFMTNISEEPEVKKNSDAT